MTSTLSSLSPVAFQLFTPHCFSTQEDLFEVHKDGPFTADLNLMLEQAEQHLYFSNALPSSSTEEDFAVPLFERSVVYQQPQLQVQQPQQQQPPQQQQFFSDATTTTIFSDATTTIFSDATTTRPPIDS